MSFFKLNCFFFVPKFKQVESNIDLQYFDEYPDDLEEAEDETSGWDEEF